MPKKASIDIEKEIIVDEITFLIENGYRKEHALQIMEGIEYALATASRDAWKGWSECKLSEVIDVMYDYGMEK
jgi:hypothetical protein